MTGEAEEIQAVLHGVLECADVLGVVATSREGLVLGAAGVPSDHAELIAALGWPLARVAERTMERLGGGSPELISIVSGDGAIHVCGAGDLALIVLTDRRAIDPLKSLFNHAAERLSVVVGEV